MDSHTWAVDTTSHHLNLHCFHACSFCYSQRAAGTRPREQVWQQSLVFNPMLSSTEVQQQCLCFRKLIWPQLCYVQIKSSRTLFQLLSERNKQIRNIFYNRICITRRTPASLFNMCVPVQQELNCWATAHSSRSLPSDSSSSNRCQSSLITNSFAWTCRHAPDTIQSHFIVLTVGLHQNSSS